MHNKIKRTYKGVDLSISLNNRNNVQDKLLANNQLYIKSKITKKPCQDHFRNRPMQSNPIHKPKQKSWPKCSATIIKCHLEHICEFSNFCSQLAFAFPCRPILNIKSTNIKLASDLHLIQKVKCFNSCSLPTRITIHCH